MNYAQVIDGIVVNVVVWDGTEELDLPGELIELEDGSPVSKRWTRVDDQWVQAPPRPGDPDRP